MLFNLRTLAAVVLSAAFAVAFATALATTAFAQIPEPPSTFWGSVSDAAGEVPEGVTVEAYVGNNFCGESVTRYAGEGSERVTTYVVDVVSDSQVDGCGEPGDAVRIRIGDRLSPKFTAWEAGPVRFDIIFGENVTPKPIPTLTPTPTPIATATPNPATRTAAAATGEAARTGTPDGQGGDGTPGTRTTGTPDATGTGVTSSTPAPPGSGDDDGDGGFPLWGTVLLALLGLGLIGAGAGIYIARQSAGGEP